MGSGYNNLFYCECNATSYQTFPSFQIQIENITYNIPKENYIQQMDDGKCVFKIMHMEFPPDK